MSTPSSYNSFSLLGIYTKEDKVIQQINRSSPYILYHFKLAVKF